MSLMTTTRGFPEKSSTWLGGSACAVRNVLADRKITASNLHCFTGNPPTRFSHVIMSHRIESAPLGVPLGTPPPYSVDKFLLFIGLQGGLPAKILLALDLAAESSRVRTYELFSERFALFVPHCGNDVRHECAMQWLPGSISNFECAPKDGNYLQKESDASGVCRHTSTKRLPSWAKALVFSATCGTTEVVP